MARWQPGTRERLATSALRLFASQGFEGTTVAEIAADAGLTERTFFRYYADKPEVLFAGQGEFEALFLGTRRNRPAPDRWSSWPRRSTTRPRSSPTRSDPGRAAARSSWPRNGALQERELHKMSALAETLTSALVQRDVDPTVAALAAEAGVSVFRRSFAAWISEGETRPFGDIQRSVLTHLQALLAPE